MQFKLKFDSSVCRICLKSKGVYSLFENDSTTKGFSFVTLLEASETDNLPSGLCEKCYLSLRISIHLKKQAIATDSELRSYLKKINETFLALPSKTKLSVDDSISDINVHELAAMYPDQISTKNTSSEVVDEKETKLDQPCDEIKVNFVDVHDDEEYDDIEELMDETNAIDCDEIPTDINKLIKFKKYVDSDVHIPNFKNKNENKIKTEYDSKDSQNSDNYILNTEDSLNLNFQNDDSSDSVNKNDNSDTKNKNTKYRKRRYLPDIIKVSSVLGEGDFSQKMKKRRSMTGVINDIFHCGECDNTFTTKLNLDRHMEIHLNRRKAYSCETCGKLFTQLNSVREHMLTHTGEKPFKCDICQKAFSRRQIYKRHLLTHTKIKKYACKQCDQKFTVKRTLLVHRNRFHGEGDTIEHKCQICYKSYRSKYTLSDHLQNVHNITL
ncbi:zinc finger protein 888-like [Condylostylus longicornis]|uniref:zinc finger protein 888-like n=1 Tax=Condylostylus longicornis TaxID=2530218 RepID=UPI00244DEF7C|nr:zinc finger protein 888-like [Condylostylus longicornis]